ncbi:hypothetical protein BJ944DRAFT_271880 [Cunninghamella echinulata]|nr:hypothetical protein BJ944DRAFT_271880 [Cunninghamella echinulata]
MNLNITREQAICIFFCEEYNEENKTKLVKRIDEFKDMDICYEKDPSKPILMSLTRIYGYPSSYHKYTERSVVVNSNKG